MPSEIAAIAGPKTELIPLTAACENAMAKKLDSPGSTSDDQCGADHHGALGADCVRQGTGGHLS